MAKVALINGSAGLIGSEAARFFAGKGYQIIGVDNDMRKYFFLVKVPVRPGTKSSLRKTLRRSIGIMSRTYGIVSRWKKL